MYFIWYVYKGYNDQSSKCTMIEIKEEMLQKQIVMLIHVYQESNKLQKQYNIYSQTLLLKKQCICTITPLMNFDLLSYQWST